MSPLIPWANFYVIVGSSAGALTGLTFVVISLVTGSQTRTSSVGVSAFTTPTVVHFGAALLVAASLSAPWPALAPAAVVLGLCGLGGVAYVAIVIRRLRRFDDYVPVREDWLWYGIFPLVAYAALVVAAMLLPGNPTPALFAVGAVTLLLLFIGIHNAWDVVTYLALEFLPSRDEGEDQDRASSGQASDKDPSETSAIPQHQGERG